MLQTESLPRSWAEIQLSALHHNLDVIRRQVGPHAGLIAVVKADAYGHGASRVCQAIHSKVAGFAVASVDEGTQIREARGAAFVLILGACSPGEKRRCVEHGFIPTVSSLAEIQEFAALAGTTPFSLNLKIDSGMGRMGVHPNELRAILPQVAAIRGASIALLSTHLPVAEDDAHFSTHQLQSFQILLEEVRHFFPNAKAHALNSAGILRYPEYALDYVRPGLSLYGIPPCGLQWSDLRPALSWKAQVLLVKTIPAGGTVSYGRTFQCAKDTKVALLGVGYADGLPRQISGKSAEVLIHGRRCPILGRITMDLTIVDVSHLGSIEPGAIATLIGTDGQTTLTARDLAQKADTIPWEILTGIQSRVKRLYLDGELLVGSEGALERV